MAYLGDQVLKAAARLTPLVLVALFVRAAISSTMSTMARRSLMSGMRVKARISASPSDVARKSAT